MREQVRDTGEVVLNWAKKMPKGVISPMEYFRLLARLVEEGQKMYRREQVFLATPLTGLRITTTDRRGNFETEVVQKAEPLILRFDTERYAHPKDRRRAVYRIFENAAERRINQEHLNNPDFMGPDIWTWTQKQWDKEAKNLVRDPQDPGKYHFTDEGREAASRFLLDKANDCAITLPVSWGAFELDAGGALATYMSCVDELTQRVNEVRRLLASVESQMPLSRERENLENAIAVRHLFHENAEDYVAAVDVYGQMSGYARANFHDEAANEAAMKQQGSLVSFAAAALKRTLKYGPPGMRARVPGVAEIDEIMARRRRQEADPALEAA